MITKALGKTLIVAVLAAGCSSRAGAEGIVPPITEVEASVVTPTSCAVASTPAQTEGPYYLPGSPDRTDLADPGIPGAPLLVTGAVMDTGCEPVAGATIDFWQADGDGEYDNIGFRLRGNQLTGSDGSYRLETVIPGVYPGRTPHIHVKIFGPDGEELLTTQLYLRGISDLTPDGFFDARLLASDEETEPDGRRHVSFDFVVQP
jgi:protocatechuate 3,4-dioxygenase beta subunit